MVSLRCKMIVKSELENLGLKAIIVELGEVEIPGDLTPKRRQELRSALARYGFELLEDKKKYAD